MTKYKHLISFDLSSYGAALSILNQFADGETIKDFELSVCGSAAQLILLSQDAVSLQVLKGESRALFKSQILDVQIVENMHEQLLPTYLAQNRPEIKTALSVFEGSSVSTGLQLLQSALLNKVSVVEFRIIRTFPKNVVVTMSADSIQDLEKIDKRDFKLTQISKTEKVLKSYFEI